MLAAGADVLHVDIMDGHFVPNLSMGPGFVESIRRHTNAPLDVHIMVTDAEGYAERFADAGADSVTFHIEACGETTVEAEAKARRIIRRLHERGVGAGVTLRPGTGPEIVEPVAGDVDLVLVMTVEPGYGGQAFMDDMLDKITILRGLLREEQRLEVDGGIDARTGRLCAERGADVFVAGSSVFRAADMRAAVRELRSAVEGDPATHGA